MKLNPVISDFEGNYKAYTVQSAAGAAYQGSGYGHEIDFDGRSTVVMTSSEAAALYADAKVLELAHEGEWPGAIRLVAHPVHMVSLSLTFNQVSRLINKAAAPDGTDPVAQAIDTVSRETGLRQLGSFMVMPRKIPAANDEALAIRAATPEEVTDTVENKFDNIILTVENTGDLLSTCHWINLYGETLKPGYAARTGGLTIAGLFMDNARETVSAFPLPEQENVPVLQVINELARVKARPSPV